MSILSIIILSFALGLDSFVALWAIGSSLRSQRKRVFFRLSLLIGLFHFVMPLIGSYFSSFLVGYISDCSSCISASIFVFLGLKMIYESFQDEESSVSITLVKSMLLGYALSIDALAAGFSVSLTPQFYSIFTLSAVIAVVAFIMSYMGYYLGMKSSALNGRSSYILGGVVLIILGIKGLF